MSHQIMFLHVLVEKTVVRTWKRPASAGYQLSRSTAALNLNWFATCHLQSGVSGGHIMKKSFPECLLTCRWVFLIHIHMCITHVKVQGPLQERRRWSAAEVRQRTVLKLVRLSSQASPLYRVRGVAIGIVVAD